MNSSINNKNNEEINTKTLVKEVIKEYIVYFIFLLFFIIACLFDEATIIYSIILIIGVLLFLTYKTKKLKNEKLQELHNKKLYEEKVLSGEIERERKEAEKIKQEETEKAKVLNEERKKEREILNDAEDILINCEGNLYKAIRILKEKYNLTNEIAKKYIQQIKDEYTEPNKKEENNSTYNGINKNVPKCPTCGSTHVEKIGMVSKMVSTDLLGLASNSIGKTFKCNNCGHKW